MSHNITNDSSGVDLTQVTTSIIPADDGKVDLGSATKHFDNLYVNEIVEAIKTTEPLITLSDGIDAKSLTGGIQLPTGSTSTFTGVIKPAGETDKWRITSSTAGQYGKLSLSEIHLQSTPTAVNSIPHVLVASPMTSSSVTSRTLTIPLLTSDSIIVTTTEDQTIAGAKTFEDPANFEADCTFGNNTTFSFGGADFNTSASFTAGATFSNATAPLQITPGAAAGCLLASDASGNANWQLPIKSTLFPISPTWTMQTFIIDTSASILGENILYSCPSGFKAIPFKVSVSNPTGSSVNVYYNIITQSGATEYALTAVAAVAANSKQASLNPAICLGVNDSFTANCSAAGMWISGSFFVFPDTVPIQSYIIPTTTSTTTVFQAPTTPTGVAYYGLVGTSIGEPQVIGTNKSSSTVTMTLKYTPNGGSVGTLAATSLTVGAVIGTGLGGPLYPGDLVTVASTSSNVGQGAILTLYRL